MQLLAYQTSLTREALAILQRIAKTDKTAIKDCIDAYGSLIWALARKHTNLAEEAELPPMRYFLTFGDTPDVANRPSLMKLLLFSSLHGGD
ncbi:MAG: hypothetical protein H0W58_00845 [Acidobacteria bacterium]|jgi:hypothetical protein|nr:hypothetical protein [Acidobacteriota bacterium]